MIRFAHIPKTSGYSLYTEFHPPRYNFSKSETCLRLWRVDDPTVINAALFRRPLEHVFSQYKECRFDAWGKRVTARTAFPRAGGVMDDFEAWLGHFARGRPGDFGCYHPYNMQTRCAICTVPSQCHHDLAAWPDERRALDAAFASIDALQWVGVQDLFHESVCVLRWRLTGRLPADCDCSKRRRAPSHPHVRHNVPRIEPAFTPTALERLRNMTRHDRVVYEYARRRAVRDILRVEAAARPFWCAGRPSAASRASAAGRASVVEAQP